ncbi:MAG: radical SAM protein [Myxococcales bacterium]|nr:MAG: radical SAM protein [Myxococcales bacterium]
MSQIPPIDAPRSAVQGEAERVDINLGHACNHKCVFCMQSESGIEQKKWVSLDKLREELRFYAEQKGVRSLGLLGGEPTLYPWLEEGLIFAGELGYNDITINTNGFRLGQWEFASMAAERGIRRYCLSIHSEDPAVEDFLSGQKGAFVRKMRAIRNLTKLKASGMRDLTISINAVLNKKNLPTLDRFVKFFKHLGIVDIRFNFIRPEGRAAGRKDIVCTFSEAMPKLMELVALNGREWKIRLSFGEIPYCVYRSDFFKIEPLRRAYIGEYVDRRTFVSTFGNTPGPLSDNDGHQRFIWQDLKMNKLKSFVSACTSCAWREVCGGVWTNYLEMYGDKEFRTLTE